MVAQLEHQLRSNKLTLQALWYYVQPPLSGGPLAPGRHAPPWSAGRAWGLALIMQHLAVLNWIQITKR